MQKNQVENQVLVFAEFRGVGLRHRIDRLMRHGSRGNDAPQIAHLRHREIIHAQHGFEQLTKIQIADLAIGIDGDATAFDDAGIENVVQLEFLRQHVDDFSQRRAREVEAHRDRRALRLSRRGCRGRCGRSGLSLAAGVLPEPAQKPR